MAELREIASGKRKGSDPVRAIAGRQHGIVARPQLLAVGLVDSAIHRALRAGRLHLVHPGVYSTQAPELAGEDALLIAALLAAGDGAALSHGTAAWRWRIIPAPPTSIEVAVPTDRRPPRGLTLHRSTLRPADLTLNAHRPTTPVPRTLLDLATTYAQQTPPESPRRSRVPP